MNTETDQNASREYGDRVESSIETENSLDFII